MSQATLKLVFLSRVPYYRKLTLVLIRYLKLTRLKLTRIEGKKYFIIKEINAKEVLKF